MPSENEDVIDSIRDTILEGIEETNDERGPNWEVVARMVYEAHVETLEVEVASIRGGIHDVALKAERKRTLLAEEENERLRCALYDTRPFLDARTLDIVDEALVIGP